MPVHTILFNFKNNSIGSNTAEQGAMLVMGVLTTKQDHTHPIINYVLKLTFCALNYKNTHYNISYLITFSHLCFVFLRTFDEITVSVCYTYPIHSITLGPPSLVVVWRPHANN